MFKMFNKNGYSEEMKRHNRALEDLDRAKERFFEEEARSHDREQELRRELEDGDQEPRLDQYYRPNSNNFCDHGKPGKSALSLTSIFMICEELIYIHAMK